MSDSNTKRKVLQIDLEAVNCYVGWDGMYRLIPASAILELCCLVSLTLC